MSRSVLRLVLGLVPFVLIAATLVAFLLTRDAMAFAVGGLFAGVYVVGFLLWTRAARPHRRTGRKRGRGRRPRA